jgi:serine/threonine-protein kinase
VTQELRDQLQATLAGSHTVDRELGGGGMSRVFVATESALGREVVIKVLPGEAGNTVSVERFKREIAVIAKLQHPHIVAILTAGESNGQPFYTMPFVKGDSLRARLSKSGELSVNETIHILRDIASALAYAHGEGVVHRDIKPENVIVSGGVAVVTDFGVAKAMDLAIPGGGHQRTGLTSLGIALGTPAYMAPEQATADPHVDHRADIYAFGCVAYEMLAGSSPFAGRPLQQLLAAHVTDVPESLARRRPNIPPALAELVMRCLEKRPGNRPQSADAVIAALDAIGTPSGGSAPTEARLAAARATRSRQPIAAGLVVVAIIAGVAAVVLRRGPSPLVMGVVTKVTRSTDTLNFDAAISPDGKFVAYVAGSAAQMRLFVRQVSGSSPVALATGLKGNLRWPRWSPDGSRLAFTADNAIFTIPVLGGAPQLLVEHGASPAWSPDGSQLAYVTDDALWLVPVAVGRIPHRLVTALTPSAPAWSPDGSRIAFVVENAAYIGVSGASAAVYGNISPSSIWTVRATGGDSAIVTDRAHLNTSPAWWPDGRSILFVSDRDGARDVYRQPVRPNGRPEGSPDRVTSGINAFTITLSRDGSQMAYSTLQLRSNVWMAPIFATATTPWSAAHQVTSGNQAIEGLSVSHDGKWLAYDSDNGGRHNIFKIAFNGTVAVGEPVALTTDSSADFEPRWSPDDSELAFHSQRFGTRDIFTVRADGRDERRVTDLPTQEYYPDWSPDGLRLVYASPIAQRWDVFIMSRGPGGKWSAPARVNDTTQIALGRIVRWTPDGYSLTVYSPSGLAMLPTDRGSVRPLVDAGRLGETVRSAVYARDASTLMFLTADSASVASFWSVSTAGGTPRRLLRLDDPSHRARRPEFDSDGKNLFFTIAADEAEVAVVTLKRP